MEYLEEEYLVEESVEYLVEETLEQMSEDLINAFDGKFYFLN